MRALESKMYIHLVYRLLVWCGAVGYMSGLRDAALLSLSCGLYGCWAVEGQLKKRVWVSGAFFMNEFVCLVEGLYVVLLVREKHALVLEGLE